MIRRQATTVIAIVTTLVFGVLAFHDMAGIMLARLDHGSPMSILAQATFMLITALLLYGGLVYQLCRLFHLRRREEHAPLGADALDAFLEGDLPSVTVLVPSYKEEARVVTQTLLSAALQSYWPRRVVLLIDDDPDPRTAQDQESLRRARDLPRMVEDLLSSEAAYYRGERVAFLERACAPRFQMAPERARLLASLDRAIEWFQSQVVRHDEHHPDEATFIAKVLEPHLARLRARADVVASAEKPLTEQSVAAMYQRLERLFDCELTSFERKRYANLSHAANKAMNLNSYIGLMGNSFREERTANGVVLTPASADSAGQRFPAARYLVTLDADSLIAPDYVTRLVQLAEQPGNERLAVLQTPYSAFPGATAPLERIAGATTDIQYNIHQGFTACNATYWVGANALIRTEALDDIAVTVDERGYPIRVFVQDRTVIEDTESTVDLIARGWRLYNYPERLAFSATPPDFGSLVIQRRRWANGGLLILPKLLRYLARHGSPRASLGEAFFRIHYLVSIACVNVGLLVLLAIPFVDSLSTWWLPFTALPYFVLYAQDLSLAGYRRLDLLRVYCLNLVLIPVNLAGVLKSLEQALLGHKLPFGRTPKVKNRTAAPAAYIVALYLLVILWFGQATYDFWTGLWTHGVFAAVNATLLIYGIAIFVGFRHSWEDITGALGPPREVTALLDTSAERPTQDMDSARSP